jgi:S-adenosylmethionine hydrolase
VHVVVVDPGVGSQRRPIIAETKDYIFVAPDNGVLSLVEAREPKFIVRHITAERYFLQPVSQTFHGRDIFAPVAGWLSKGVAPSEFGPEISDYVRLPLPQVERIGQNSLRGVVLKVDKFGNLITNIGELDAPVLFGVMSRGEHINCRLDDYAPIPVVCARRGRRDIRDRGKLGISGDRSEAGIGGGEAGCGSGHASRSGSRPHRIVNRS